MLLDAVGGSQSRQQLFQRRVVVFSVLQTRRLLSGLLVHHNVQLLLNHVVVCVLTDMLLPSFFGFAHFFLDLLDLVVVLHGE